MFRKVLIANRGEIAVRITRTLREMGIRAVAVYSDPDARAMHVREADEAYPLGGTTSAESYLRGERIIDIARAHGVDAIHPGYGFLSENAAFARACADAGVTFIGPSPEATRAMGDKIVAKRTAALANVPVIPGVKCQDTDSPETIRKNAERVGFPLLVKAAGGGGGKGMRRVNAPDELAAAMEAAQREALKSFGDGRMFLERYIEHPRHLEIQIFGDAHGNVVHLFERECSIQRRHQKIIEETPSPALTPELRARMGEAAVRVAKAIEYRNAGTVEFILAPGGEFFFLEVNARLQVEHPITEMTTLNDLVRAQVQVAAGEALPFKQEELHQHGHAIECRIYAEDPARGFMPSVGVLERFIPPVGPNIRVETGFAQGDEVSTYYDPMLAKLVVWAEDRPRALARMNAALRRFVILGVTTNVEFLHDCIAHPAFEKGEIDTHFLQTHDIASSVPEIPDEAFIVAALSRGGAGPGTIGLTGAPVSSVGRGSPDGYENPWRRAGAWRVG